MRARRDPEGRKRAIVEAAADLIAESGIVGLTHRKIAARAQVPLGSTTHYFASLDDLKVEALEHIANVLDDGLQVVAHELAESSDWQRTLAQVFYGYLSDPARVRSDVAFYVVGTGNPALRPLASRWFDGLVSVLADYVELEIARAIAVYGDGAMVHTLVHGSPPSEDAIADVIGRLLGSSP
ncbi:MAG: TetR family transcriptional regulator [Thermoleophilia bacterium]